MTYAVVPTPKTPFSVPQSPRDLGPAPATVFATMSDGDALHCLKKGSLLPTRELIGHPDHRPLGSPDLLFGRLRRRMQEPYLGYIGDNVSLTYTPTTVSAYGSCGPFLADGAIRMKASDLVVAAVSLEALLNSKLALVFKAVHPLSAGGMTETPALDGLPWDLFRNVRFSRKAVPDDQKRAAYQAEVLVWGGVPLSLGVEWCVVNEAAAAAFAAKAGAIGVKVVPLVRPEFFFE